MSGHGAPIPGGRRGLARALHKDPAVQPMTIALPDPLPTDSAPAPRLSLARQPRSAGPLLESLDDQMGRVLRLVEGVAPTPATVLILGESGTGKEVLARHIHTSSDRAGRPFVAINCGAVPASLVESELFGHERGAFSGATERRIGRIESAHGGTLLLDEISEMPLELQTRLLRVLQEREVHRVGGSHAVPVDVRIIATSNRDLRSMVAEGRFREDLYYRINVFPLHVPPLRQRMEDLPALTEAIGRQLATRFGRAPEVVTAAALARLACWHWPGNVRELSNVLERAFILCQGRPIEAEHIFLDIEVPSPGLPMPSMMPSAPESLADLERETILQTVEACDGNRTHAARRLGISIRTLRNRLAEYRLQGVSVPPPRRGVRHPRPASLQPSASEGSPCR